MAENIRPPVAVRIVRPYESEDELFEHELETVGKTSVILIGAHPRPTGVILRFEVTLASGATVLRGEGRVLAHKENAFRGQAGLTLRFTRLDPKSKGVVDRASALREARQAEGGTPSRPPPRVESPIAEALTASTPAPSAVADPSASGAPNANAEQEAAVANARASAREKANATARANAKRTGGGKAMALTPPPLPVDESPPPVPTPVTSIPGEVRERPSRLAMQALFESHAPGAEVAAKATSPTISAPPLKSQRAAATSRRAPAEPPPDVRAPIDAPPDRADLLARLRERAGRLPPERIEEILAARR